jgi:hypothetical protein
MIILYHIPSHSWIGHIHNIMYWMMYSTVQCEVSFLNRYHQRAVGGFCLRAQGGFHSTRIMTKHN